jgi:hypothetical protein
MIEIAARNGNASFYLKVSEVESIFEAEGNTSEIITISGNHYASIWPKEKIAQKINQFIFTTRYGDEPD